MLIGQCGMPKSGNYLLYRILRMILQQLNNWNSYSAETRCWDSLFRINNTSPIFPEVRDMDEVRIDNGEIYLLNSQCRASFALWDLEKFNSMSRLIWTHQTPILEHHTLLGSQRRWFYILRDGRDVVNSWLHYVTSPHIMQRHPNYKISQAKDLYRRYDVFEKCVRRWASHVQAYIALQNHYLEVRYENLIENKVEQIQRIAAYLGVSIPDVDAIVRQTSVQETRLHAPRHVRRARKEDWRNYFDDQHKKIFQKIAEPLLEKLGYSTGTDW